MTMTKQKKIIAMIPARMNSTRYPGKPLIDICGKTMIEHVWQRVKLCDRINSLYIVTCDQEIRKAAKAFGAEVIMTSDQHERCSDRVAEACQQLLSAGQDFAAVINVQGDEPLLNPKSFDLLLKPIIEEENIDVVNLIESLETEEEINSENNLKVVFDLKGFALYFSRMPIPDKRRAKVRYYKQLGMYCFSKKAILKYAELDQSPLEIAESNDLLRFSENGIPVRVVISPYKTQGVDTPSDHKKASRLMKEDELYRQYLNN